MGREAKTRKDRVCHSCNKVLFMAANELKSHAETCKRVTDIGLVLPTVERPKTGLVTP